jgi:trans-aconitate 2-methyltransferase
MVRLLTNLYRHSFLIFPSLAWNNETVPSWDVERYEAGYSFVWNYGAGVIDLLAPQPGERILDLGCGAGQLTHEIASRGARVIGLDSSASMVAQARINYPDIEFVLADAAHFALDQPVDAVFSNAALHWIADAGAAVECVSRALRPGGRFVAEFGGKDNTREILAAVAEVLGGNRNPWYFPSIGEYATLLESKGLRVTQAFHFDRPTELTASDGMAGWLEMFGGRLFEGLDATSRRDSLNRIVERLRSVLCRDGRWYVDYRRLRIVAVRED